MKWLKGILFLILLLVLYFLLWPTPVAPQAWQPDPIPELTGKWAANKTIQQPDVLYPGLCDGCEDVAISTGGTMYGSSSDGTIKLFRSLRTQEAEILANTGGRPLGMHFDKNENLWVCNADQGLLQITLEGGVFSIVPDYEGEAFRFTNDLDIGQTGMVYFTDASQKYGIDQYKFDLIEHRATGRFFSYNPAEKITTLLADELYFANGVAVEWEENFALVCETGNNQVRKIWLKGPKKGTSEVIIDNLPGYPDGISRGSNGIYWLTLISPRKGILEKYMNQPLVIKMIAKLPEFLQPAPGNFLHILGINAEGEIVYNIQKENPTFGQISSVQESYGQLFFGSLNQSGIGRIPIPQ